MSLSTLPVEILNLILTLLDYVDFMRLRSTSRYFDTLMPILSIKAFVRELDCAMTDVLHSPFNHPQRDGEMLGLAIRLHNRQRQPCRACARILPSGYFFSACPRYPTSDSVGRCMICLEDELACMRKPYTGHFFTIPPKYPAYSPAGICTVCWLNELGRCGDRAGRGDGSADLYRYVYA